MTECERLLRLTKTIAVLDHHRQSDEVIENAVLSYIEPNASSACEMVAEVLQYIGDDLRLNSSPRFFLKMKFLAYPSLTFTT